MQWTQTNIDFLRNNVQKMSNQELGQALGIDYTKIVAALKRYKIKRTKEATYQIRIRTKAIWSPEQLNFVRQNYSRMTTSQMAEALGKTKSAVKNRINILGLSLPENLREARKKAHSFKKGNTAWNKGMKGLQIGGQATQFKKGHIPHNARTDGEIVLRFHKRENRLLKMLKVAGKRCLVWLHRYVWEQANGPIPKGYLIVFKDGNTLNCELANLELMSMADNASRNRNIEKQKITFRRLIGEGKINVSDKLVAHYLSFGRNGINKQLVNEYLKYPELLEAKRQSIQLNRRIKYERAKNNGQG
jgi:hypothetical protein